MRQGSLCISYVVLPFFISNEKRAVCLSIRVIAAGAFGCDLRCIWHTCITNIAWHRCSTIALWSSSAVMRQVCMIKSSVACLAHGWKSIVIDIIYRLGVVKREEGCTKSIITSCFVIAVIIAGAAFSLLPRWLAHGRCDVAVQSWVASPYCITAFISAGSNTLLCYTVTVDAVNILITIVTRVVLWDWVGDAIWVA